jgi:hypothetical protein
MHVLNFPPYAFNIKSENGRNLIFDMIRKKYVVLTPEEWVRQHVVRYLAEEKGYPMALMALETAFALYLTIKRTDILIYNRRGIPLAMVECKSASVKIDHSVFDQILRYNLSFKLKYLIVTNGLQNYCCKIDPNTNTLGFLNEIPTYEQINEV